MLHEFIAVNREEIIRRCRAKVATRPVPPPTSAAIDHGVPTFLLLQNAFKFTRPRSTVTLRVGASAERVLIEIPDECGGLPRGNVNELFRPFEQRGADRTGFGLGLALSRRGVEANNGRIYARNLPEKGSSSLSTCRSSQFPPWRWSSAFSVSV